MTTPTISPPRIRTRRYLKPLALLLSMVLLLPLLVVALQGPIASESIQAAYVGLDEYFVAHQLLIATCRVVALIALIAVWPAIVKLGARLSLFSQNIATSLISFRWRLALWLVALELIVGQNLLVNALAYLLSWD